MAEATITTTVDPRFNGNRKLESLQARGLKIEIGEILFDGGTYTTGGIAWTPVDVGELLFVSFSPEDQNAGGYVYTYDYDNGMIQVYESGTASAALDELDTTSDTLATTVRYLAIGV